MNEKEYLTQEKFDEFTKELHDLKNVRRKEVAENLEYSKALGDLSEKQLRNGLKNMRRRLADIHGEFDLAPNPGGGTVVKLTVPISSP